MRRAFFVLLVFAACSAAPAPIARTPAPAAAPPPQAPPVLARAMYEDFEGYQGLLTQTPWPIEGGWMVGPYGHAFRPLLDKVVKFDGTYSLRIDYRVGAMDQIALSRLYSPPLPWGDYDAVRFWLKPDGSGRRLTFFVLEQIGPDHKKWFWEAAYDMTGTEPVFVTMPFAAFYQTSEHPDPNKRFDWSRIEETVFWVRAASDRKLPWHGTGPHNPELPSTIWIDAVETVKLAAPLDHVVAVPAPARLSPAAHDDGVVRIDYGADADWTDADGRRWLADVPATEGGLVEAPSQLVFGSARPEIYRTARKGVRQLRVPVKPGRYVAVLHVAELDAKMGAAGRRVFSVDVEGRPVGPIDPWDQGGGVGVPLALSVPVDVRDGELTLRFSARRAATVLNALEVFPVPSDHVPPPVEARRPLDDLARWDSDAAIAGAYVCDDAKRARVSIARNEAGSAQALRFDYDLDGDVHRSAISYDRLGSVPLDGWDGLRFWWRPDGSGRSVRVHVRTTEGGGSYPLAMRDARPGWVTIPWAAFGPAAPRGALEGFSFSVELVPGQELGLGSVLFGAPELVRGGALVKSPEVARGARRTREDFESYADDEALHAVWQSVAGDHMSTSTLDRSSRGRGNQGLRLDYGFGKKEASGLRASLHLDWRGQDAVRFWLRPDGSGNTLRIAFVARGTWETRMRLDDTRGRWVEVPMAAIFGAGAALEDVEALLVEVKHELGGAPSGTIYLDELEAVRARP